MKAGLIRSATLDMRTDAPTKNAKSLFYLCHIAIISFVRIVLSTANEWAHFIAHWKFNNGWACFISKRRGHFTSLYLAFSKRFEISQYMCANVRLIVVYLGG